ncbi:MAG: hypothetical protein LKF01_06610 [Lactobacillus sp.]|jgi:uncharacterized protein YpmB|nr:hypothetical protein [Lactobacillus sp.]MCH3906280.1 hypothetical protein [Lactobacillus sp.]MCH3990144.1 hypothetical protein [Lactobacillus sp.]MCH4069142.1 hypothetical protein [Lactobacillus sp.]MCI1303871.1 hypothetical protein [Lactobacillus sp.]
MRYENRQTLIFVGWLVGIIVVLALAASWVLAAAGSSRGSDYRAMQSVINRKTPIVKVDQTYHLSRSCQSVSASGFDKRGHRYYFVFLPNSKRAYLYAGSKGKSAQTILKKAKRDHGQHSDTTINLGWYRGQPVWEVAYRKQNGNCSYILYSFKTGKQLSFIDNL